MCLLALKTTRADRRCCALPTRSISVQLRGNETQWPTVFLKNCLRHVLIYNSNCAERELFSLDALPERFKRRNHVTHTSASPPTAFIYTADTVINSPSEQRCEDGGVISGILQFQKQKPRQFSCWGLTVGALQGSGGRVTLPGWIVSYKTQTTVFEYVFDKMSKHCITSPAVTFWSPRSSIPLLNQSGPQIHLRSNYKTKQDDRAFAALASTPWKQLLKRVAESLDCLTDSFS